MQTFILMVHLTKLIRSILNMILYSDLELQITYYEKDTNYHCVGGISNALKTGLQPITE